jgi:hypothetical protein
MFVETRSTGWVSAKRPFEDAVAEVNRRNRRAYDGQVAIWHWKGQGIPENTVEDFVRSLKRFAPSIKQVWVKTNDGPNWQGRFDNSALAINGPESIDQRVNVLERNGLEFHAWCVLRGEEVDGEANAIIQTCLRPGVKSMILDVEPYDGYWEAGKEPIRPLMVKVRQAIPAAFHLGLGVDPREVHYNKIFPKEWFPFINSVHTSATGERSGVR